MPLTRFAAEVVGSLGIGTRVGQGVDGGRVGEQLAGSVASRRNAIRAAACAGAAEMAAKAVATTVVREVRTAANFFDLMLFLNLDVGA